MLNCIDVVQEKRDLITGLKTKTHAGRPNWGKVGMNRCKIRDETKALFLSRFSNNFKTKRRGKLQYFIVDLPHLVKLR